MAYESQVSSNCQSGIIPDALWNEARLLITPSEKSNNSIGRPAAVVSFRMVFDGIVYVLVCLKNWC
ncbi:MAG: hypothetical protein ACTHKP_12165 [Nitrososphaeraceae archaeon]